MNTEFGDTPWPEFEERDGGGDELLFEPDEEGVTFGPEEGLRGIPGEKHAGDHAGVW